MTPLATTLAAPPSVAPGRLRSRPRRPIDAVPEREHHARATPDRAAPALAHWTLVRVKPTDGTRVRSATWRRLVASRAVSLGRGRWALTEDPRTGNGIEDLIDDLRRVGATVEVGPIGLAQDDAEARKLLDAAVARRWSHFWDLASAAAATIGRGETGPDVLAGLRDAYVAAVQVDFSSGGRGTGAAARLTELAAHLRVGGSPPWSESVHGLAPSDPHLVIRHQPLQLAGWSCEDGSAEQVFVIDPAPSMAWEEAFVDFERYAYRPSPTRPALEHGIIRWRGPAADALLAQESLRTRLRMFERSLPD